MRFGAACAASFLPTRVDPVNVRTFVIEDSRSWDVTEVGSPKSKLTTPAGSPASASTSTIRRAVAGLNSEALSTTVQPAASAAPSFRVARTAGKFQAVTAATTPSGVGVERRREPSETPGKVEP